jgi:hypothetical protein
MEDAVRETVAVARADGVALDADELVAATWTLAGAMAGQYSSTAQDLQRGKPTEIDALNGFVAERGAALGVPTPVNRMLHALVKLRESATDSVPPVAPPDAGAARDSTSRVARRLRRCYFGVVSEREMPAQRDSYSRVSVCRRFAPDALSARPRRASRSASAASRRVSSKSCAHMLGFVARSLVLPGSRSGFDAGAQGASE